MTDPTLHLFANSDELEAFGGHVAKAYCEMLEASARHGQAASEAGGTYAHAVLLGRLALRMLQYKSDESAKVLSIKPEAFAIIDAEAEALWPVFKGYLDAELAEGAQVLRDLATAGKTN